jgi:glyoxylase-like metal-dependent hydrolase (beta-lactamase superfamily II)
MTVSRTTVDGDVGNLAVVVPDSAPAAAVNVTVEELAPGIWYLAGQSHHSLVVEFADHLTLIEAPQSDARTLAVIEKARTLRPGKPVTEVVVTHHHFDHTGGLRAAVSEGLRVITHESNREWFEDLVARKHTIVPDALARNPRPLSIRTVDAREVLSDATRTVELHQIAGNLHNEGFLMVYFPAERLLVQADAYNPPTAAGAAPGMVFPFAANLVENVQRLGLSVERVAPIHGRVLPWSEVMRSAGR